MIVPGEATVTEHLGDLFWRKKDSVKALQYFKESLAILGKKDQDEETQKDVGRLQEKITRVQGKIE